jgi:hypothetical protein
MSPPAASRALDRSKTVTPTPTKKSKIVAPTPDPLQRQLQWSISPKTPREGPLYKFLLTGSTVKDCRLQAAEAAEALSLQGMQLDRLKSLEAKTSLKNLACAIQVERVVRKIPDQDAKFDSPLGLQCHDPENASRQLLLDLYLALEDCDLREAEAWKVLAVYPPIVRKKSTGTRHRLTSYLDSRRRVKRQFLKLLDCQELDSFIKAGSQLIRFIRELGDLRGSAIKAIKKRIKSIKAIKKQRMSPNPDVECKCSCCLCTGTKTAVSLFMVEGCPCANMILRLHHVGPPLTLDTFVKSGGLERFGKNSEIPRICSLLMKDAYVSSERAQSESVLAHGFESGDDGPRIRACDEKSCGMKRTQDLLKLTGTALPCFEFRWELHGEPLIRGLCTASGISEGYAQVVKYRNKLSKVAYPPVRNNSARSKVGRPGVEDLYPDLLEHLWKFFNGDDKSSAPRKRDSETLQSTRSMKEILRYLERCYQQTGQVFISSRLPIRRLLLPPHSGSNEGARYKALLDVRKLSKIDQAGRKEKPNTHYLNAQHRRMMSWGVANDVLILGTDDQKKGVYGEHVLFLQQIRNTRGCYAVMGKEPESAVKPKIQGKCHIQGWMRYRTTGFVQKGQRVVEGDDSQSGKKQHTPKCAAAHELRIFGEGPEERRDVAPPGVGSAEVTLMPQPPLAAERKSQVRNPQTTGAGLKEMLATQAKEGRDTSVVIVSTDGGKETTTANRSTQHMWANIAKALGVKALFVVHRDGGQSSLQLPEHVWSSTTAALSNFSAGSLSDLSNLLSEDGCRILFDRTPCACEGRTNTPPRHGSRCSYGAELAITALKRKQIPKGEQKRRIDKKKKILRAAATIEKMRQANEGVIAHLKENCSWKYGLTVRQHPCYMEPQDFQNAFGEFGNYFEINDFHQLARAKFLESYSEQRYRELQKEWQAHCRILTMGRNLLVVVDPTFIQADPRMEAFRDHGIMSVLQPKIDQEHSTSVGKLHYWTFHQSMLDPDTRLAQTVNQFLPTRARETFGNKRKVGGKKHACNMLCELPNHEGEKCGYTFRSEEGRRRHEEVVHPRAFRNQGKIPKLMNANAGFHEPKKKSSKPFHGQCAECGMQATTRYALTQHRKHSGCKKKRSGKKKRAMEIKEAAARKGKRRKTAILHEKDKSNADKWRKKDGMLFMPDFSTTDPRQAKSEGKSNRLQSRGVGDSDQGRMQAESIRGSRGSIAGMRMIIEKGKGPLKRPAVLHDPESDPMKMTGDDHSDMECEDDSTVAVVEPSSNSDHIDYDVQDGIKLEEALEVAGVWAWRSKASASTEYEHSWYTMTFTQAFFKQHVEKQRKHEIERTFVHPSTGRTVVEWKRAWLTFPHGSEWHILQARGFIERVVRKGTTRRHKRLKLYQVKFCDDTKLYWETEATVRAFLNKSLAVTRADLRNYAELKVPSSDMDLDDQPPSALDKFEKAHTEHKDRKKKWYMFPYFTYIPGNRISYRHKFCSWLAPMHIHISVPGDGDCLLWSSVVLNLLSDRKSDVSRISDVLPRSRLLSLFSKQPGGFRKALVGTVKDIVQDGRLPSFGWTDQELTDFSRNRVHLPCLFFHVVSLVLKRPVLLFMQYPYGPAYPYAAEETWDAKDTNCCVRFFGDPRQFKPRLAGYSADVLRVRYGGFSTQSSRPNHFDVLIPRSDYSQARLFRVPVHQALAMSESVYDEHKGHVADSLVGRELQRLSAQE